MMVRATRGRGTVRRLTLKKSVWSGQKRLSSWLVVSGQNPREFEQQNLRPESVFLEGDGYSNRETFPNSGPGPGLVTSLIFLLARIAEK